MTLELKGGIAMPTPKQSLSLKKVSEITHVAPLKQGFVPSDLAVTYPTRLKMLLRALFALRQKDVSAFQSPVDRLGLIHFARWLVIDGDTRLMFSTNFDGSWENYIHAFVDTFPRLLDLIWSHCEGYPPRAADSYREFSQWVERYQVETDTLYASNPDVTVLDIKWMKELKRHYDEFSRNVQSDLAAGTDAGEALKALQEKITTFRERVYGIRVHLPPDETEPMPLSGRDALERLRGFFAGADRDAFDAAVVELDPHGQHDPSRLKPVEARPASPHNVSRDNVQAGILEDYGWAGWGSLSLLQIEKSESRNFLRAAREVVSTAAHPEARGEGKGYTLNLAMTHRGLRRLGLSEAELDSFPIEFQLGMEDRAEVLRDIGMNHPRRWPNEIDTASVDVVLIVHARDEARVEATAALDELLRRLGVREIRREQMSWPEKGRIEPFGFVDGVNQPEVVDVPSRGPAFDKRAARGEFLIGHPNDRGEVEYRPQTPEIRNDSTYLVIRKLEQNPLRFQALVDTNAEALGMPSDALEAALMGAHKSGTPLDEPAPSGCPFHGHARRANPRRKLVTSSGSPTPLPRIARRAMPYLDGGGTPRGLMFMAVNASIASQFEVIQQSINGANITGGMSTDPDPIVGARDLDADALPAAHSFCHDGRVKSLIEPLEPEEPLVRLRWGLYLFVPSMRGIEHFIEAPSPVPPKSSYLDAIRALGTPGTAPVQRNLVKRLMEEVGTSSSEGPKLWAELRQADGPVATAYGTLVAKPEEVRAVLENPSGKFSVREYDHRMKNTTGEFYLGFDDQEKYERESAAPNRFILNIDADAAYQVAQEAAKTILDRMILGASERENKEKERRATEGLTYTAPLPGSPISLRLLASQVLLVVSNKFFGVPELVAIQPGGTVFDDVRQVSAYIFYPDPEAHGESVARKIGRKIQEEVASIVAKTKAEKNGTLVENLLAHKDPSQGLDDDWVVRSVCGVVSGFYVPTLASFLSIMATWHKEGELDRIRSSYQKDASERSTMLEKALIQALRRWPMPNTVYREATEDHVLPGGGRIAKGTTVVAGLVPADRSVKEDLLFGAGRHDCKGKYMALGILRGLIACLLEKEGLRPGVTAGDLLYEGPQPDGDPGSLRQLQK